MWNIIMSLCTNVAAGDSALPVGVGMFVFGVGGMKHTWQHR